MALSRPRVGFAVPLSLALALALSGCGTSVSTQDGGGPEAGPSQSTEPNRSAPGGQPDEADNPSQADADGGEDPAQDRVRTGPVAQYGGPAYGDQGVAEIIENGLWCKTIAVFWGGEPVPDGVSFTFETAVTDRPGLQVEGGICGTRGADRSCLGMRVLAGDSGIFCSLVLRPGTDFQDGTAITFTGTLECPTAEICDAVAAREVEPGPAIIVDDPASQEGG